MFSQLGHQVSWLGHWAGWRPRSQANCARRLRIGGDGRPPRPHGRRPPSGSTRRAPRFCRAPRVPQDPMTMTLVSGRPRRVCCAGAPGLRSARRRHHPVGIAGFAGVVLVDSVSSSTSPHGRPSDRRSTALPSSIPVDQSMPGRTTCWSHGEVARTERLPPSRASPAQLRTSDCAQ